MESRTEKYNLDYNELSDKSSRSNRNAKLYREVYGKYNDLDNLPIEDNTDEIDMAKLKELLISYNQKKEEKEIKENLNVLEQRKRKIDEQRVYDINKILEKAKYENNKLKSATTYNEVKPDTTRLSLLKSSEISLTDIKNANNEYQEDIKKDIHEKDIEEQLSMTREIKYQNLTKIQESELSVPDIEDLSTKELSLDLFEDLKPSGNTITMRPVKEENVKIKQIESNFRSADTRDIDIIKSNEDTKENDFFTSSYHFSKNDFSEDDDFFDKPKKGGLFKIILLILAITVFVGVIVYFVGTYGLGI